MLSVLLICIIAALMTSISPVYVIITGLLLFGIVFAINSAVHSYLILYFSQDNQITMDVGFYYMANAAGRLVGTILSGITYQYFGLMGCMVVSLGFVLTSVLATLLLRNHQRAQIT